MVVVEGPSNAALQVRAGLVLGLAVQAVTVVTVGVTVGAEQLTFG